jgi:hypothetical protein
VCVIADVIADDFPPAGNFCSHPSTADWAASELAFGELGIDTKGGYRGD